MNYKKYLLFFFVLICSCSFKKYSNLYEANKGNIVSMDNVTSIPYTGCGEFKPIKKQIVFKVSHEDDIDLHNCELYIIFNGEFLYKGKYESEVKTDFLACPFLGHPLDIVLCDGINCYKWSDKSSPDLYSDHIKEIKVELFCSENFDLDIDHRFDIKYNGN